jgi:hypothetical protein
MVTDRKGVEERSSFKTIYKKIMQQKESKTNWHFRISLAKSAFRLAAGLSLCVGDLITSGLFFIVAEILGIVEEL